MPVRLTITLENDGYEVVSDVSTAWFSMRNRGELERIMEEIEAVMWGSLADVDELEEVDQLEEDEEPDDGWGPSGVVGQPTTW